MHWLIQIIEFNGATCLLHWWFLIISVFEKVFEDFPENGQNNPLFAAAPTPQAINNVRSLIRNNCTFYLVFNLMFTILFLSYVTMGQHYHAQQTRMSHVTQL